MDPEKPPKLPVRPSLALSLQLTAVNDDESRELDMRLANEDEDNGKLRAFHDPDFIYDNDSSPSKPNSYTSALPQISPSLDMVSVYLSENGNPNEPVSIINNKEHKASPSSLKPLSLTLPNISSISNKIPHDNLPEDRNFSNNNFNFNSHFNTANNQKSTYSANDKYYLKLLEDVNMDDQSVMHELIDKLSQLRIENQNLKEDMWNKVDLINGTLIQKGYSKEEKSDSLLYDSNLSNDELLNMLKEQRLYNKIMKNTIDDYQTSFNKIMDSMVDSNKNISNDILQSIKNNEVIVEEESDKMWDSWNELSHVMGDITDFNKSMVDIFKKL